MFDPTEHHLVPKCRGGKVTVRLCRDCHRGIHELYSNKTLETEFGTPELLKADARFQKMVTYIRKQDPGGRVKFRKSKRRFGRNG